MCTHSRVGCGTFLGERGSMVRQFERMIIPVSGHYVSLEQLNWLRRIVREERHMLEA